MNKITGTAQALVDLYTGGPYGSPPPAGPCNLLYCVNQQGNLQSAMFLSETDYGAPTVAYNVSDVVPEADFLVMGPEKSNYLSLWPIKVSAIDTNTGVITCPALVANDIIGGLQTGTTIYTITQQGNVAKIAFCSPNDQGQIKWLAIIDAVMSETEWKGINSASIKVDAIQL